MTSPAEEEAALRRYMECLEVMARAAKAAGFDGVEVATAACFYFASSLILARTPVSKGEIALRMCYQYLWQNPRLVIVDIDAVPMN